MTYKKIVMYCLCMLLWATGCNQSLEGSDEKGGVNQQNFHIMVPHYYNESEKKQWLSVARRFEEIYQDVDVHVTAGNMLAEDGHLTSMLQSGNQVPDVMLINAGASRIQTLIDGKRIQPLNEQYQKYGWQDQIRSFALESIQHGDILYEVPYNIDVLQVYYNKDMLDQHGLRVPSTFRQFVETCEQLNAAGEVPITVGARDAFTIGWLFANVLESVSEREATRELMLGDGDWTAPHVVDAAKIVKEWVEKDYITNLSLTYSFPDSKYSFLAKESVFIFFGTYQISDFVERGITDTIGVLTFPSIRANEEARPSGGVGLTWVIPTQTENQALAEKWLNFVLSSEYYEVLFADPTYSYVPAAKSSLSIQPASTLLRQVMKVVETEPAYNPAQFVGPQTREIYFHSLQSLIRQSISPEEAVVNIQAAKEKDKALYELDIMN